MSKQLTSEKTCCNERRGELSGKLLSKKEANYTFRVGRYGVFFLPRDPSGHIYRLLNIVPLDGWITDPHEIIEAIANDPDMSISYSKKEK